MPTTPANPITDLAAREAARTTFDRPLVVEAGAGTGKTTTLIARLCTWCLGPGWERAVAAAPGNPAPGDVAARVLEGIVAITFTEAAAAEMAAKLGEALVSVAGGSGVVGIDVLPVAGPLAAERARHLLAAVDRLAVSTIHAWCSRVLSMAPVQAGLHPQFQVDADGSLLDEVVHEVVVDWFTEVFGTAAPQRESLLVLADRAIGSEAIALALSRLATEATPAQVLRDAQPTTPELAAFFARTRALLSRWLADVEPGFAGSVLRADLAVRLLDAVRGVHIAASAAPSRAALERLCAAAQEVGEGERSTLSKWSRGRFTNTEARLLNDKAGATEAASALLLVHLDHLGLMDPVLFDSARAVLAPLLERVEAELSRRGVVTFDQLLRRTRDLLANHPEVLSQLRGSLHLLHVDEFQDTDGLQCEIVAMLALEGEKRPALFVVGDPKQSIYGWRSADLGAYQAFVDRVMAAGGERLSLEYNRRSVAPVLDEVERVIRPLMRPLPGFQPDFQALVSHRGAATAFAGARGAVEYWISWGWNPTDGIASLPAQVTADIEAKAIAADLVGLRAEGLRWSDVGILMRSASDLDIYLEALREAGVPYVVERDRNYFRRREIVDAAAILRAVLEPSDTLALLTLFRSPAVGVPDAALLPLWRRQLPARMAEVRTRSDLDGIELLVSEAAAETMTTGAGGLTTVAGWPDALLAAIDAVAWLREHHESLPADRFVEELRARIPLEPVAAGRYLGSFRVANLHRYHTDLINDLADSARDPQKVLRALRRGVKGRTEAEEARPELKDDAVRVMTVHKAKGLEFEHVYVVQLHKERRDSRREWSENAGEATSAVSVGSGRWELRLFGSRSLGYDGVVTREKMVDRHERLRLLYVAMTRARDRLVMLGQWTKVPDPAPSVERATSLLGLVMGRTGGHPTAADVAAAGGQVDGGDALWRIPAMVAGSAPEAGSVARPPAEDPTPADLERRLARRAEHILEATARMDRRTSAPASDAAHRVLEESHRQVAAALGDAAIESEADAAAAVTPAAAPSPLPSAVGTAVHRALELMDPAAPPARALRDAILAAEPVLVASLPEHLVPEGRRRAERLLARFVNGELGAHFRRLGPHFVARELPTLAAPTDDTGPVGFFAGAIDLVHLDPATGELVVVDYKTDGVRTEAELDARVAAYRLQGNHYVSVLQSALGLDKPPRMELWFLSLDRRVE